MLADLSCQGKGVRARLGVRRFVYRTRRRARTTFGERFPMLIRAYARRALRQADAPKEIGFALGRKVGAQLPKCLAMPAGRDPLLKLMRNTALPTYKTPRMLGIDDFAWEKGDHYGTLLVD